MAQPFFSVTEMLSHRWQIIGRVLFRRFIQDRGPYCLTIFNHMINSCSIGRYHCDSSPRVISCVDVSSARLLFKRWLWRFLWFRLQAWSLHTWKLSSFWIFSYTFGLSSDSFNCGEIISSATARIARSVLAGLILSAAATIGTVPLAMETISSVEDVSSTSEISGFSILGLICGLPHIGLSVSEVDSDCIRCNSTCCRMRDDNLRTVDNRSLRLCVLIKTNIAFLVYSINDVWEILQLQ